jgi:protein-S-isoprenylcysteine O-methyltransferase Ste14
MSALAVRAVLSVVVLVVLLGVILFATAGTFDYLQAWVYLINLLIGSLLTTLYLLKNDPELLRRRLKGGPTFEQRPAQRIIMMFATFAFIALLVVPALDHRSGWSRVPLIVPIAGNVLFLLGYYFIYRVFRENSFTSATIEVAANQKVIDTGPYAIVRHPMYSSALLYLLGTPLALGSFWGVVPFLAVIPVLIWRIFDEEKMLAQELKGYSTYQQKVPYRLVPGLW